jgi:protoporphyrinogen IX oxidase
MVAWILVAHIFGFVFWVGGLLVTTLALSRHIQESSPEARQALARLEKVYLRGMADLGALVTVLAGIALIETNRAYYLHARWLYIKLAVVAVLIVLHWLIATRTKSYAAGRAALKRGDVRIYLAGLLAVFVLILIATLPGEVYLFR